MNKRGAAAALILLGVLVAGIVVSLRRPGTPPSPTPPSPTQQEAQNPAVEPVAPPPTNKITIYTVRPEGGDANDLVPKTVPLTNRQQPARTAIDALIQEPNSPLPEGTKLIGIKIEDKAATVDFSPELKSAFNAGETRELQAVNSILMTLGQFPSIDQVTILVAGSAPETSTVDLSGPQDVIRSKTVQANSKHEVERG